MKTPRVYKTEAVVLHQRKLGEADKILSLYTPYQGRFDVVAKGVRRPNSRKAGHVEVLAHTSLLIARGRSLDIVTQSEGMESFVPLREDLARLSRAMYCVDLVGHFCAERVENDAIFCLLLETLRRLAERDDLDVVTRYFELQLMDLSGYRPQLASCASCHATLAPVLNYYGPSAGGAVCSACRLVETSLRPLTVNALKVMRLMQRGSFSEVARLRLPASLAGEIEEHLRQHIRYLLERDVKSLGFIQAVRHSLPEEPNDSLPSVAARVVS